MAKIIPFPKRRATGSWDADMRIHNPETCTKVARRIACDACGYPACEARYLSESEWRSAQTAAPRCHDDVTFMWLDEAMSLTDGLNKPEGEL